MSMPRLTLLYAIAMILLGVVTYAMAPQGHASATALIPSIIGLLFVPLGIGSMKRDDLRKHLMHAAAALALLATLAGFGRAVAVLAKNHWDLSAVNHLAFGATLAMGVLSGVYLALCVRSFIAAKRARLAS